jgi:hypothetical protein
MGGAKRNPSNPLNPWSATQQGQSGSYRNFAQSVETQDENPTLPGPSTMTNYRRNHVPGGTFFFTLAIAERHLDLLVRPIANLKAVLRDEQQRAPFVNLGLVPPPNHLHSAAHWLNVAMCPFLTHLRTDDE